jgi:hypothetical protein
MQIFKPSIYFIENHKVLKARFFLTSELPIKVLEKISHIPGIGTPALKKNIKKGKLMVSRAWETSILFDHFTNNSWIYETKAVEDLYRQLSPAEREVFVIDPKAIDWR